ncbi:hypothetical protein [Actinocorallia libanotica]|uniref:Uncharacterized protein n=1 Tax=Actinocorallia libanotica TaxID=46162 RepID=A0ABP4AHD1_9ACTN
MAVEQGRPCTQDGTWALTHGSWVDVDDGAVTLHLLRSDDGDEEQALYVADLEEANELLRSWGFSPQRLVSAGFDEDCDLFELA